jgi:hypothetical protein
MREREREWEKKIPGGRGVAVREALYDNGEGGRGKSGNNVLKVRSQCPLVLLVKVGCRQGKVSGSEGVSVVTRGLLGCAEGGTGWASGLNFVWLGGQKHLTTF